MRCALLLSLIAAARAFAPPSILRASVVVKNEADAASTAPESHGRISIARRVVMPRALRRGAAPRFDAVATHRNASWLSNHDPLAIHHDARPPPTADTHCTQQQLKRIGGFRYDNSDSVSPLEKKQALQETASWCLERCIKPVSYTHLPSPRDMRRSRMPSSA